MDSKTITLKRVCIAAGGTGGHVFPGLSIARALRARAIDVLWLGTSQGIESKLLPAEAISFYTISIRGLRQKGIWRFCVTPFYLLRSIMQSYKILRRFNPDVVLSMGGYVSGPVGIAAWLLRKPLVIHEQNAIAGLTNKILSRFARKILTGFQYTQGLPSQKTFFVGNPIRTEIENLPAPLERFRTRENKPLHILIFGGSQGALSFNEIIPCAIAQFKPAEVEVWHQAGERYQSAVSASYRAYHMNANVETFIHDMAKAYDWADIVIARAGALTVSELAAAGLGAILIPYPHAVDDHQTENAQFLSQKGAAILLPQAELTESKLYQILRTFLNDRIKILSMANAAYALRKSHVVETIIEELEYAQNN